MNNKCEEWGKARSQQREQQLQRPGAMRGGGGVRAARSPAGLGLRGGHEEASAWERQRLVLWTLWPEVSVPPWQGMRSAAWKRQPCQHELREEETKKGSGGNVSGEKGCGFHCGKTGGHRGGERAARNFKEEEPAAGRLRGEGETPLDVWTGRFSGRGRFQEGQVRARGWGA